MERHQWIRQFGIGEITCTLFRGSDCYYWEIDFGEENEKEEEYLFAPTQAEAENNFMEYLIAQIGMAPQVARFCTKGSNSR